MGPCEGYAGKSLRGRGGDPGFLWYGPAWSDRSLGASVAGAPDEEDGGGDITGRPRWTEAGLYTPKSDCGLGARVDAGCGTTGATAAVLVK